MVEVEVLTELEHVVGRPVRVDDRAKAREKGYAALESIERNDGDDALVVAARSLDAAHAMYRVTRGGDAREPLDKGEVGGRVGLVAEDILARLFSKSKYEAHLANAVA